MTFSRIKCLLRQDTATGIKVTLKKFTTGGARLIIAVREDLFTVWDWSDGDSLEVWLGEGDDTGKIQLVKNNSWKDGAPVAIAKTGGKHRYAKVNCGHIATLPDRSEKGAWCPYEKKMGTITITLPAWARQGLRGPTMATPLASLREPIIDRQTSPRQDKISNTAGLLGDPPPGRREMLKKIGEVKP